MKILDFDLGKLLCILSTKRIKFQLKCNFLNASFQSPCLKGEVYFWPLLSMVYSTTTLLNKLAISTPSMHTPLSFCCRSCWIKVQQNQNFPLKWDAQCVLNSSNYIRARHATKCMQKYKVQIARAFYSLYLFTDYLVITHCISNAFAVLHIFLQNSGKAK